MTLERTELDTGGEQNSGVLICESNSPGIGRKLDRRGHGMLEEGIHLLKGGVNLLEGFFGQWACNVSRVGGVSQIFADVCRGTAARLRVVCGRYKEKEALKNHVQVENGFNADGVGHFLISMWL